MKNQFECIILLVVFAVAAEAQNLECKVFFKTEDVAGPSCYRWAHVELLDRAIKSG